MHGWRAGDAARRRLERARRAIAGSRGLVIRPRAGRSSMPATTTRVRADAAVTINGLVRWTIDRGLRRARGVGRHARARSAARSSATRTWRAADRRPGRRRVWLPRATGRRATSPQAEMDFGYDRSRLQRHGRGRCCRRRFAVAPTAIPAALRAIGTRSRSRSASARSRSTSPSAGCIFQNPEPGARRGAGGHPAVGGRARRSRRAEGRARSAARACRRRTRNFIVNDGRRHGGRHPRAHRALPRRRCASSSASSCATRSSILDSSPADRG